MGRVSSYLLAQIMFFLSLKNKNVPAWVTSLCIFVVVVVVATVVGAAGAVAAAVSEAFAFAIRSKVFRMR